MTTQSVHMVFSSSAAGCLKYCFQENQLAQDVYPITDDLSYGPLHSRKERLSFGTMLINTISPDDHDLLDYFEESVATWADLAGLQNKKIIIWHCENAPEQLALQMAVSTLQHVDALYEIAIDNKVLHARGTAEFAPEKLATFIGTEQKISLPRKQHLADTWKKSVEEHGLLRIWQDKQIHTVDETFYDKQLIAACTAEFTNAARIVGEVLGTSNQLVSDTWINYRLVKLVENGKLKARGNIHELRSVEVCLP